MVLKINNPIDSEKNTFEEYHKNKSKNIIGIDSGITGAIAYYNIENKKLKIFDMPTIKKKVGKKERKQIDSKELTKIFKNLKNIDHAFIEKTNAYPQQGVVSVFNSGHCYGVIIGVLSAIYVPITIVSAKKWKEDIDLKTKKISKKQPNKELKNWAKKREKERKKNKEFALDFAKKQFPRYGEYFKRKKDDGRAEAALIALWGATKNNPQENNN